ncbi:hypothetical protein Asp14428_01810 [Actinoplanes sp. NBRC 14428]|nr:hypothetical protein Asp14428_01810 [Actinoplanes sp. NBRC 14428]
MPYAVGVLGPAQVAGPAVFRSGWALRSARVLLGPRPQGQLDSIEPSSGRRLGAAFPVSQPNAYAVSFLS